MKATKKYAKFISKYLIAGTISSVGISVFPLYDLPTSFKTIVDRIYKVLPVPLFISLVIAFIIGHFLWLRNERK